VIEKKNGRMEAMIFQVVRLCEPMSIGCRQCVTSLLYSLCMIFWMITMCCEMSYLYIRLLTQFSYLTYVGFLNNNYPKLFHNQNNTIQSLIHRGEARKKIWDRLDILSNYRPFEIILFNKKYT
jgi:hypothetical protein